MRRGADIAREGSAGERSLASETETVVMPKQLQTQSHGEADLAMLGDLHPLVQQLGSTEGLHELSQISRSLRLQPISGIETLRSFLRAYQSKILIPLELPIIHQAYLHAAVGRTRELVDLDQRISAAPKLKELASASQRVGQEQLRRLRPLRDVRVLQRYLAAVEAQEAQGWHTLVFGLTLAIYSVPLRQGLLGYAQQVIRGFIHTASTRFSISSAEVEEIFEELDASLPMALGALLFLEGIQRSRSH